MTVWKMGDALILSYREFTVGATVKLASSNGRSLMLAFEALVGGYAGMMPVLQGDDGRFRDLITSSVVELTAYGPPAVHVLREGAALCGMPGIPASWPPGHRWVGWVGASMGGVTCWECLVALDAPDPARRCPSCKSILCTDPDCQDESDGAMFAKGPRGGP